MGGRADRSQINRHIDSWLLVDPICGHAREPMTQSPSDAYRTIGKVIERMRALGLDPGPLETVQATAYTTASEWLGDLRQALGRIQRQGVSDPEVRSDLAILSRYAQR